MVAHTGATDSTGRLRTFGVAQVRPLNRPRPLRVEADADDHPVAVWLSDRRYGVEAVLERWRIDDEWWRQKLVSRLYHRLLLEDGRTVDVYRDLTTGRWARQSY